MLKAAIKITVVVGLIVLAVPLGWRAMYPTSTFRYRLTLMVETPEGLKTGSSVIEIVNQKQPNIGDSGSGFTDVGKGEAVTVDLGPRGILFALLKGADSNSDAENIVNRTFPPPTPYGAGAASLDNLRRYARSSEKADLPLSRIPLLVRFRDIADPRTVERVDPNDLAASFGKGVRIRRATLELTQDAVTNVIISHLPWLKELKSNLDGTNITSSTGLSNTLNSYDFVK